MKKRTLCGILSKSLSGTVKYGFVENTFQKLILINGFEHTIIACITYI